MHWQKLWVNLIIICLIVHSHSLLNQTPLTLLFLGGKFSCIHELGYHHLMLFCLLVILWWIALVEHSALLMDGHKHSLAIQSIWAPEYWEIVVDFVISLSWIALAVSCFYPLIFIPKVEKRTVIFFPYAFIIFVWLVTMPLKWCFLLHAFGNCPGYLWLSLIRMVRKRLSKFLLECQCLKPLTRMTSNLKVSILRR